MFECVLDVIVTFLSSHMCAELVLLLMFNLPILSMPSLLTPVLPIVITGASRGRRHSERVGMNQWEKLVKGGSSFRKGSCFTTTEVLLTRSSLLDGSHTTGVVFCNCLLPFSFCPYGNKNMNCGIVVNMQ